MTGQQVSHYRILEPIGKGGMGVIYKAEDTKLGRTVALKFLPPDSQAALGEDAVGKERFLREAKIAARLNHPHICPIYDVDEAGGRVFFAMAYIEGQPLSALIPQGLTTAQVLDLGIQIASGLDEAARQGVVHRDIKSANIVVSPQGQAYILDFGLALAADSSRLTRAGAVCGTPAYMSPEQAQGLDLDPRTDIWSLGVVLFEMLTRRQPFEAGKDLQVLYRIVNQAPLPLAALRPDLPPDYERVIGRALAKNPAERWQTAGELARELRRLRDGASSAAPSATAATMTMASAPATHASAPATRRRAWVTGGAGVGAALAGLAYYRYAGASLPKEKHIAVLPFGMIGGDEALRAITDGLVETLTARLTDAEELRGVLVVPASEIRARKIASAESAKGIYGANLVVTGSVQRLGQVVEILMNLVDATTMRQTGSRTVQADMTNPLALRDQALAGLVHLLQVQSARLNEAVTETSNPGAYADYLRGRGYLARYDVAGNIDRAIEALEAATRADAGFAVAFASLAEACFRKAVSTSDKQMAERARAAAARAVGLNPQLALAHARLGDIHAQSGRRDEAIAELRTALKLDPGSTDAHRALAALYTNLGRFPEAEALWVDITQRRPSDWYGFNMLGVFYWARQRHREAEAAFQRASALTPDNEFVRRNLAGLYVRTGRYAEAQKICEAALRLAESAPVYSLLGLAHYHGGRYAEAAKALEASIRLNDAYYAGWGNLGSAYRHVPGAKQKADDAFRRAIELAQRRLEVTPEDYNVRASLAEYHAKLGERDAALAEVDRIPLEKRPEHWGRIAQVQELTGDRAGAVATITRALAGAALPNEVKDDPDLADLLRDPALRRR